MFDLFKHPGIWKVSATAAFISGILFVERFLLHKHDEYMMIDGLSMFLNTVVAFSNYLARDEWRKQRRQHLIYLTVGK